MRRSRSANAAAHPTKAQFARATKRICARTEREVVAYVPIGTDPATRRANRRGIITLIRRQTADIQALGYPAGSSPRAFDNLYRDVNAALDRLTADERLDVDRVVGAAINPHMALLEAYAPDCQ